MTSRQSAAIRSLCSVLVVFGLAFAYPRKAGAAGFDGNDCELASSVRYQSEGPTDPALFAPSSGELNAAMLFVDFDDAPSGEERTEDLADLYVPDAQAYYDTVSRGRLRFRIDPQPGWYRMPRPAAEYDPSTTAGRDAYLADAVRAADADVDFSRHQVLFVVASGGRSVGPTRSFTRGLGAGVPTADGTELRWGAFFGPGERGWRAQWAAETLAHEVGHNLGLPDVYRKGAPTFVEQAGDAGAWDLMGLQDPGAQFTAWHQRKLGWIDAHETRCASGELTEDVAPLDAPPGGVRALFVPTGPSSAYAVEVRRPVGVDAGLCSDGVLVYRVDANRLSGDGPLVVRAARPTPAPDVRCGPLRLAPFDRGKDEACLFEDSQENVRVEVLARRSNGGFRVRVSPLSMDRHPESADCSDTDPAQPDASANSASPPAGLPESSGTGNSEMPFGGEPPSVLTEATPSVVARPQLRVSLRIRSSRLRGGALELSVRCSRACAAILSGSVRTRGVKVATFAKVGRRAPTGRSVPVTLRVKRAQRASFGRASRGRERLTAQIGASAVTPSGERGNAVVRRIVRR